MSRYSWGILEKIFGIVPRKFQGICSEELFSGNSQEFPQIWSTFSPVILQNWYYKKFLGTAGYEKFLGMGYEKFPRMGFEKILRISVYSFTGFSRKDSLELPRIFCKIVTWGGPHCSLKVNSITDCRLLLPYCSFILFYPRLHIVFTHCPPLFRL